MTVLPEMIVNRKLMTAFLAEEPPCTALGIAQDDQGRCGMIALRLNTVLPRAVAQAGFSLGNGLFGGREWQVLHLAFNFYGFRTYNLLINPALPAMSSVWETIIETEDYMFLVLNSGQSATAFRSDVGPDSRSALIDNPRRLRTSTTTQAQYERAVDRFVARL